MDIGQFGSCVICGAIAPIHDCHLSPEDGCDCADPSALAKADKEMELLDNVGR